MVGVRHSPRGGRPVRPGAALGGVVAIALHAAQDRRGATCIQIPIGREGKGCRGGSPRQEDRRLELQRPAIAIAHLHPSARSRRNEMSRRNCGPVRRCETAVPVPEPLMQSRDPVSAAPSGQPQDRVRPTTATSPFIPDFEAAGLPFPHAVPRQADVPPGCRRDIDAACRGRSARSRANQATQVLRSRHRRRSTGGEPGRTDPAAL
jgi:hypothetical protein